MTVALPAGKSQFQLRHGALPPEDTTWLVCGMFTPSYAAQTHRLLDSLVQFNIPHALFEVSTVHRSISPRGTDDPACTKANLIRHVWDLAHKPVLYMDVDCVVRQPPVLIDDLVRQGVDFAAFNWMAADQNDAYIPVEIPAAAGEQPARPRYYRRAFSIDLSGSDQLITSGAVQLWRQTPATRALLDAWVTTILAQPGVTDDECLDFAFNNADPAWRTDLRPAWLPKSYARYPWWIFDEPVIDHPDIPYHNTDRIDLHDPAGRKRHYPERAQPRPSAPYIPADHIIDIETGRLYRPDGTQYRATGQRWPGRLWPLP